MSVKPGDSVLVHAYKHNASLYRCWENAVVFENNEDYLILINEEVIVTEINGRKWKTNEPAIWFFFKNSWYNIICMFKERGINYYCNMASPYIIEGDTVKYIDYDLDIKVFNDGSFKILDLREFNRNRISYKYSKDIVDILWTNVDILKKQIKSKKEHFDHEYVKRKWEEYKSRK